ncbi:RNA 3'-terminal phosphate cyclase [Haladaptatus sp. YSMS36]|uniref:RNA 3'-terminal phosphate cyclase n=1 Tax=Haladaptatus sp. YSMS36 TaxID=3033384 RepID=UPI0023E7C9BF|nr:RNA 3'-terminal phosphate cyclase [Haladaptatus sp. YSMS36]
MLTVDGSDGGGQILRTALSLSTCFGRPVKVTNIRGARPNPGLRNQHLTVVETLAEICDATVSDVAVGTEELTFDPGPPAGNHVSVDVGTAGSLTLLFDALLPLATTLTEPLTVTATGGTDVKWAPTAAWYEQVKLPLLARFGLDARLTVDRSGFYPVGGGEATLRLRPSEITPLTLGTRGNLESLAVTSIESNHLSNADVAARQATEARRLLDAAGHEVARETVNTVESASPGSTILVRAAYEHSLVGFDALGEKGKPAEKVAADAVNVFRAFHQSGATVDSFLADQLLVWLALGGGEFLAPRRTSHLETNRRVLDAFGYAIEVEEANDGLIRCSALSS